MSSISASPRLTLQGICWPAGAIATGTTYIAEMWYNGTTFFVRRNGVFTSSDALASIFNGDGLYTFSPLPSFGDPFPGYIHEHQFFNVMKNIRQHDAMLAELSQKWSVALA